MEEPKREPMYKKSLKKQSNENEMFVEK